MKLSLTLIILSFGIQTAFCQDDILDMSTPSSPASKILDLSPSTVLTPKSYKALETTLFSNFTGNSGNIVPNDFSLDFMPYWVKDRGLSLENYLRAGFNDQFFQNLSISVASTQDYLLGNNEPSDAIAFGIRSSWFMGNEDDVKDINSYMNSFDQTSFAILNITTEALSIITNNKANSKSEFIAELTPRIEAEIEKRYHPKEAQNIIDKIIKAAWDKLSKDYSSDKNNYDTIIDEIVQETLGIQETYTKFEDYIEERPGWYLDIGFATLINFPESNFESLTSPKQSLWITPSYQFKKDLKFLKALGVFRYESYNLDFYKEYFPDSTVYQDNRDFGLSVSGSFENLSIEFEAVRRFSKTETLDEPDNQGNQEYSGTKREDYQFLGTLNYKINENILLSYSLGDRFPNLLYGNENTLISLLTLNFGFGGPTKNSINSL